MESSSQMTDGPSYPVQFSVAYPDRQLNRLTTAFRILIAIPIFIVAASIGGQEGSLRPASMAGGLQAAPAGSSSWRRS